MPTSFLHYAIQLKDSQTATAILAAGGTCYVAKAGLPDKQTIYDKTGATQTNPIQLTAGFIDFYVDSSVSSVDLYLMAPGGQFLVLSGVVASGPNEISVNTQQKRQLAKIPFNIGDTTATTETDTGFNVPDPSMVLNRLHGAGLDVTTADSAKTIDVGILSTETGGDANGLIAASSVGTAGQVIGTDGALFSTNAPHKSDAVTGKSLSYTLSSGTTTAKGYILLPYQLS